MNSRDGTQSWIPSFLRSNSMAAAIALAVQLPNSPWSYTGGHWAVRSARGGSVVSTSSGVENITSRLSGRSGIHPYLFVRRAVGSLGIRFAIWNLFLATSTASPAAIRSREDERSRAVPLCTITLARMLAHEVKALRLDRFPFVLTFYSASSFCGQLEIVRRQRSMP